MAISNRGELGPQNKANTEENKMGKWRETVTPFDYLHQAIPEGRFTPGLFSSMNQ